MNRRGGTDFGDSCLYLSNHRLTCKRHDMYENVMMKTANWRTLSNTPGAYDTVESNAPPVKLISSLP